MKEKGRVRQTESKKDRLREREKDIMIEKKE